EPPGLFSTITWAPRPSAIFCAMARAWMSVCPPGGKGTTMRTGLPGTGKDWPCAAAAKKARTSAASLTAASLYSRAHAGTPSRTHRLPHRGDDRDLVPAGRGAAHRRHLGLYRAPAAGAAREAAGVGVPLRAHRQDPRVEARPGARLLRPAGRHLEGPGQGRPERDDLQPALGRRDPRDDPGARLHGRRAGEGRAPRRLVGEESPRDPASRAEAPTQGLLRGMGRADDQR